jgi:glucan phosphorylase
VANGALTFGTIDEANLEIREEVALYSTCRLPGLYTCQKHVSALWIDKEVWTRKSILNVIRIGKFSSNRSIRDYRLQVWKVKPMPVI